MRGSSGTVGDEIVSTCRAAVYKLLRFHMYDWLSILGLAILDGVLNIIRPFYRFVGDTMIGDYMYPLKPNTVPFIAVPVIGLLIPLVFIVGYFLYKKDITDLHHAILGLLFAIVITAVITDAIKDAVGRPRPDFFWRCFPDGIAVYNNVTGGAECHGDPQVIKEGHKSFPSGHTSWSFAGLGFLSLYVAGKIQLFDRRGHVAKLALVFTPLLGALLVGLSRVDDYWHHWQDVFAGALLGLTMAALCYHQFFPTLYNVKSIGPYRYLQIQETYKLNFIPWYQRLHTSNEDSLLQDNGPGYDLERGRNDSNEDLPPQDTRLERRNDGNEDSPPQDNGLERRNDGNEDLPPQEEHLERGRNDGNEDSPPQDNGLECRNDGNEDSPPQEEHHLERGRNDGNAPQDNGLERRNDGNDPQEHHLERGRNDGNEDSPPQDNGLEHRNDGVSL